MSKGSDITVIGAKLYFLPVQTRVPLKFGTETLTWVICARAVVRVRDRSGREAEGWGETPLSVQWVWPSARAYAERSEALQRFCQTLAQSWIDYREWGHPLELGAQFLDEVLPGVLRQRNAAHPVECAMPWLAALLCAAVYDVAVHDAYGQVLGRPVYSTYTAEFLSRDLSRFISPAADASVSFEGLYPSDFLQAHPAASLLAWHLVGGVDPVESGDRTGLEPDDGYPVLLADWIVRDGLKCLKIKLRGNDAAWDYERLLRVGRVAVEHGVWWLTADFNCTVTAPDYVNSMLDRLRDEHPRLYGMILYVEQPFPYDLEQYRIDVHSVSARKPLFLDESAHDWRHVQTGRELGWTGVALKTCKTQTGALLSACWAKAHGMTLMVQDLTNPMLAQIPHLLLAAHAGTIMGVETNAMQFYPEISRPEAVVHPGLYQRRDGKVQLGTLRGAGFGYRVAEIQRVLPEPAVVVGQG